ncbi:polysaccharide pyruvyl transferase family protein [Bifidobacterium parmae]|uniref:Polysaccharide pyruvyl transferase n=1 Tax=Bifidobacterium parmae TaxID=361854 RepID=A0A2N5J0H7_9BIFI|nr:polysaccharide pyruvyl transferase family protein [Bifidobacterium parmae]PLS27704.1 Polysaccharide pyruvyl transferase [Bifidobacterium parmae]
MNNRQKIWILTINDNGNYGNRLQNYALQKVLQQYANVSTINAFGQESSALSFALKKTMRPLKKYLSFILSKHFNINLQRDRSFIDFTKRFVDDSQLALSISRGLSHKPSDDDVFVIGSDQVWNDRWVNDDMLKLRLGSYFPEGRIISYAASFGVSQVEDTSRAIFAEYLPRITSISVREDQGKELVSLLSGRDSEVVLDPTLMVSADDWRSIIPGDFVPADEQYVLTYFLGKPSSEQENTIQNYAREYGCRIRRMLDVDDPETYVAGPREFVELFSKARYVFTDSYHACCFSILFGKQFKVFNRAGVSASGNMNSRMQTLFRLFELDNMMDSDSQLSSIDYERVNHLLQVRRKESGQWLRNALSQVGVKD